MNKRVHEIAKERGLPAKQVLERLQAAGIDVKASSSSVDEATALRVLGNGDGGSAPRTGGDGAAARRRAPAQPAEGQAPARSAGSPPAEAKSAPPRTLRRVSISDDDGPRGRGRSSSPRPAASRPSGDAGVQRPDVSSIRPEIRSIPRDPRAGDPRSMPPRDPRAGDPRSNPPRDPRRAAGQAGRGQQRPAASGGQQAASGGQQAAGGGQPRQQPTGGAQARPQPTTSRQQPMGSRQQPAGGGQSRQQPMGARQQPAGGQQRQPTGGGRPRQTGGGQPRAAETAGPRVQVEARAPREVPRDPRTQAQTPTRRQPEATARAGQPEQRAGTPEQTTPAPETGQRPANGEPGHKQRPTRDSLQGERAPGSAGGRRRVVIDSQASRRSPGGGPPAQNQPPRRQRRGRRRRGVYDEEAESRPSATAVAEPDAIQINSGSTVKDVAEYLGVTVADIIKQLMALGEMATITQTLSDEAIVELAEKLGKQAEIVHTEDETVAEPQFDDAEDELVERPPVVTIMGHVDHGKTSLLDAIRETEVAAGEAGGITQHIGAYQVHHGDKTITFLDTPGHEAFTAMRARGAKVTDIAVIVVAADDGVKPQTQEAVDHAKEAEVPILVAINKIDKEGADPNRVRGEMAGIGLQPVEWGGDTEFVDVSARTKEGLENVLETIGVMAEVEELRSNPNAAASGTVIESKLDPGRGPVVTILIMRGTLEVGDSLVAGAHWGRVRAMNDFMGNRVSAAHPGEPVEVLGFDGVPEAGELVRAVENERRARQLAQERATRLKAESLARRSGKRISLEDIFRSGVQELNLVLKADVAGSLEAIEDEIAKLPQDEVSVNVIRRAVGAVTESDVMLAAASDAVILSFNVRPVGDARSVAEREGVEIRHYSVIYRAIEELRDAMQGMLAPEEVEETLGQAEVRQTFRASRVGTIAGSHVTEGTITRGSKVRLIRDGTVVYDGVIASLRRFNDDAREVAAGYDCGIVLRDFADVKEGDVLETYTTRQVERELA